MLASKNKNNNTKLLTPTSESFFVAPGEIGALLEEDLDLGLFVSRLRALAPGHHVQTLNLSVLHPKNNLRKKSAQTKGAGLGISVSKAFEALECKARIDLANDLV